MENYVFDPANPIPNEFNCRNFIINRGRCQSAKLQSEYPTKSSCSRRFIVDWYNEYEWLEYSDEMDAAFCFCCRVFNPMVRY